MPDLLVECSKCRQRRRVAEKLVCLGVPCPRCKTAHMDPVVEGPPSASRSALATRSRGRSANRTRHGCATAYLIFMIVVNSIAAVAQAMLSEQIRQRMPNFPTWYFPVASLLMLVNVGCAVALLWWRSWGFIGLLVTSVASLVMNIVIGLPITTAVGGLIGVVILYAVLSIGSPSTWEQMD